MMVSPAVPTPRTVGDPTALPQTALQEEQADRRHAASAAERKRSVRRWQGVLVRLASLFTVLAIWEIGGSQIDQALFATPSRVVLAAIQMIASGELWQYLAPSLAVRQHRSSCRSDWQRRPRRRCGAPRSSLLARSAPRASRYACCPRFKTHPPTYASP